MTGVLSASTDSDRWRVASQSTGHRNSLSVPLSERDISEISSVRFSEIPVSCMSFFFFQAEDSIRDADVTGVQTCALPISSPEQYLLALAVIALTPAIAEEFLFRGVIMRGYEKLGTRVSIVLTAIMFSLLHLSIVSLPFTLLLGILLAYIVYRSNTLFTGILYHFINNSIAVTLVYVSSILQKLFPIGEEAVESIRDIPDAQLKFTLIVMAVFGFIALAFFSGCFAGFILVTKGKHKAAKEAKIKDKEQIYAGSERQDELSLNTMDIQNASEPAKRRARIVDFIPTLIAVAIIIGILVMELLTMISSAS